MAKKTPMQRGHSVNTCIKLIVEKEDRYRPAEHKYPEFDE
jgi:hypothetical protein